MSKKLNLLFGVICPDCKGLITVYIKGPLKDPTALVRHRGKPCAPAPFRSPQPDSKTITIKEDD